MFTELDNLLSHSNFNNACREWNIDKTELLDISLEDFELIYVNKFKDRDDLLLKFKEYNNLKNEKILKIKDYLDAYPTENNTNLASNNLNITNNYSSFNYITSLSKPEESKLIKAYMKSKINKFNRSIRNKEKLNKTQEKIENSIKNKNKILKTKKERINKYMSDLNKKVQIMHIKRKNNFEERIGKINKELLLKTEKNMKIQQNTQKEIKNRILSSIIEGKEKSLKNKKKFDFINNSLEQKIAQLKLKFKLKNNKVDKIISKRKEANELNKTMNEKSFEKVKKKQKIIKINNDNELETKRKTILYKENRVKSNYDNIKKGKLKNINEEKEKNDQIKGELKQRLMKKNIEFSKKIKNLEDKILEKNKRVCIKNEKILNYKNNILKFNTMKSNLNKKNLEIIINNTKNYKQELKKKIIMSNSKYRMDRRQKALIYQKRKNEYEKDKIKRLDIIQKFKEFDKAPHKYDIKNLYN